MTIKLISICITMKKSKESCEIQTKWCQGEIYSISLITKESKDNTMRIPQHSSQLHGKSTATKKKQKCENTHCHAQ